MAFLKRENRDFKWPYEEREEDGNEWGFCFEMKVLKLRVLSAK